MWFLGLVIGAMFGTAVGSFTHWHEAWIFFGAVGAAAAALLNKSGRLQSPPRRASDLELRVEALENEVRALRKALVASRTSGAPAPHEAATAPDAPESAALSSQAAAAAAAAAHHEAASVERAQPATETRAAVIHEWPIPEAAATPREKMTTPSELSWVWQKLFGGNILAKVGVVLLFFGIGSALKLAIDFGLFPPSVRLLLATIASVAMIAFGFSRVRVATHRMFGLALQGGGFGVLYLVTYFALSRYGYIDALTAFVLFAALGLACLFTAFHFEGEPLAILGISGAFLAPLLASTGEGSHIVLFSYYAVLDVMVLAVNWMRVWRLLTVIAFVFTLLTGMSWALVRFVPEFFASTEAFLIVFSMMFSLVPFTSAFLKRMPRDHWSETVLLFGTPIAAAIAQTWLFDKVGFTDVTLSWSAVGAGVYYSALAAILFGRKADDKTRVAHAAIAVAFYTVAVPLAFGVEVTSAFWAIEGFALVWFAVMHRGALPYAAGIALQAISGVYFLLEWHGPRPIPVLNSLYIGCTVIAVCALASAWVTRRSADTGWPRRDHAEIESALFGIAGLIWWLGANFADINRFAPRVHEPALYIAGLVISSAAAYALGRALKWTGARYIALLLPALGMLFGLISGWIVGDGVNHPLHDTMVFALPAAFVLFYGLLRLHDRDGYTVLVAEAHVLGLFVLTATLLMEMLWVAEQLARAITLWPLVAWQLVPVALTFAVIDLARRDSWPVAAHRGAYLTGAAPVLLAVAIASAVYANFNHAGGGIGIPYIPFASFFDLSQIAVIACILVWTKEAGPLTRKDLKPIVRGIPGVLGFIWLSAMAMRVASHWGGVPFEQHALLASGIAQSTLSLLWTALALALMVSATRSMHRERWFTGFALLAAVGAKFILVDVVNKGTVTWSLSLIGVGLLILAASYFSPAPPRSQPTPP